MEDKIKMLNTKLDYFEGNLLSAKTKIKTLDKKNKALEYRLTLEKAEIENLQHRQLKCEKNGFQSDFERQTSEKTLIENLQNRISQLETEKNGLQSGWSQYQKEMTNKVRDLTSANQNFRNALDTCQSKQTLDCKKNNLSSRVKSEDSDDFDESGHDHGAVIISVIT